MDGGHFQPVVEEFVRGRSVESAVDAWVSLDQTVLQRITASLDELERRDRECDLKLATLVRSSFASRRLLHTMHHPTIWFHNEIVSVVAKEVGLRMTDDVPLDGIDEWGQLNGCVVPCNPAVHQYLDISFPTESIYRGYAFSASNQKLAGSKYYRRQQLVEAYFDLYNSIRSEGKEHILAQTIPY